MAAAVAFVAAWGGAYFFGGMAAGWEGRRRLAGGMENEREAEGGKREETAGKGPPLTDRAAPRPFSLLPAPPGDPWVLGFGSGSPAVISAQNEIRGRDWADFRPPALKKRPVGLLGARLEML